MVLKPDVSGKPRLAFIDAIRGLAASYVVLYHLVFLPIPILAPPAWLKPFVFLGGSGVAMFFVLSAYTMCLTMEKRVHQLHSIRDFYWRRFFRIAPLFYALLLVKLLFDYFIIEKTHSVFEVVLSLIFGFNLFPEYVSGIVMASWTIGVEMLFYLLFPLFFKFANNLAKSFIFLLLTLALNACSGEIVQTIYGAKNDMGLFTHMNILHQLPVFAMGFCVYFIQKNGVFVKFKTILGASCLALSAVLFWKIMQGYIVPIGSKWHFQALIYSLFVLGLSLVQPSILVNRFTQFLGKISYSLYLNHALLIVILVVLSNPYELPSGEPWFYLLSVGVVFALLIPLSFLTYFFIEKPGINFSHRFIARLSRASEA